MPYAYQSVRRGLIRSDPKLIILVFWAKPKKGRFPAVPPMVGRDTPQGRDNSKGPCPMYLDRKGKGEKLNVNTTNNTINGNGMIGD